MHKMTRRFCEAYRGKTNQIIYACARGSGKSEMMRELRSDLAKAEPGTQVLICRKKYPKGK
jgi:hypothetical protein